MLLVYGKSVRDDIPAHVFRQIKEEMEVVEAIWDGIVSRAAAPSLTEAQKTELDRRLADHIADI